MKFTLASIVFVICLAKLQAAPTETQPFDPNEGLKKIAESFSELSKKFEESTGLHSEFDKEKFMKEGKSAIEKMSVIQAKLKESIEANLKNLPEEIKKKLEEIQKQISESLKNLNSPEVQKSAEKLRETVLASSKKISDSFTDLATKFGVAPSPAIQKTWNEIYEEFVKSSKILQEKVTKMVEDAQNELKKKKI